MRLWSARGSEEQIEAAKGKGKAMALMWLAMKGKGKGGTGGKCDRGETELPVKVEKGESFDGNEVLEKPKRLKKLKTSDLPALENGTVTGAGGNAGLEKEKVTVDSEKSKPKAKAAAKAEAKAKSQKAKVVDGGNKRSASGDSPEASSKKKAKKSSKPDDNSSPSEPSSKKMTGKVQEGPVQRLRTKTSMESLDSQSGFKTPPVKKLKSSSPAPTLDLYLH